MSDQPRHDDVDALFVYGTLRPGQSRWPRIESMVLDTQSAMLRGFEMYDLPEGYPAVIEGDGRIVGELLWAREGARDDLLETTDRIEGYRPGDDSSLYQRIVAGQGHARAFIYVYHPARSQRLAERGERVPRGDWVAHREAD
jgi:gamma-glutamylcyclotransferase (GGCT)/AIG2-like uncharacterized protein YtfP